MTKKKTGHLSNAKILQMADAQMSHLWYNRGRKMTGAHHDGHAYPSKKGEAKHV